MTQKIMDAEIDAVIAEIRMNYNDIQADAVYSVNVYDPINKLVTNCTTTVKNLKDAVQILLRRLDHDKHHAGNICRYKPRHIIFYTTQ